MCKHTCAELVYITSCIILEHMYIEANLYFDSPLVFHLRSMLSCLLCPIIVSPKQRRLSATDFTKPGPEYILTVTYDPH